MSMKTPRFEDVIARQRALYAMYSVDKFDEALRPLSSAIEQVFLGQMLAYLLWVNVHELSDESFRQATSIAHDAGLELWEEAHDDSIELYVSRWSSSDQMQVAVTQPWIYLPDRRIRPDFAFILTGPHATKIAVELDGHDFHERTPEQAQKDKSRDRELQKLGWHVLRYTGREVLRSPEECVHEVEMLLVAKRSLARQREREDGK